MRNRALAVLPLGSIRPSGWLAHQLDRQVNGMAGQLGDFWPDVRDSGWIGGPAEGWERGPYWLDGIVPLAYQTRDVRLVATVNRWVDSILAGQADDGWMGPVAGDPNVAHHKAFGDLDVWPRAIVAKALLQFESATGDDRILPALLRLFWRIRTVIVEAPLHEWGRSRWADLAYSVLELHRRTREPWLAKLIDELRAQGLPWSVLAEEFPYTSPVDRHALKQFQERAEGIWMNDDFLTTHGVNLAMGIKTLSLDYLSVASDTAREHFHRMLGQIDEAHGQVTGMFAADEHLAGRSPAQGTETCAVVEFMYSLELALEAFGVDEALIQRLERVAFNALPASVLPNESAHQYDQQANQVAIGVVADPVYTTNGPDSNVFGLEPHFGCCTANRHQGWPKFAARLWMRADDGALVALSYAPCVIETELAGTPMRISVESEYPFTDGARIIVTSDRPARGTIRLRIPGWAIAPSVTVDGHDLPVTGPTIDLERTWTGKSTVQLSWDVQPHWENRYAGAVALVRGPLVFAVETPASWRVFGEQYGWPSWRADPSGDWNLAVVADAGGPIHHGLVRSAQFDHPFDGAKSPLSFTAPGRTVPEWELSHGAASPPPTSPLDPTEAREERDLVFRPYGAVRTRLAELPWVEV